jgi:dipeptidyl aminopeptidase/acylaminoacyl peptidase
MTLTATPATPAPFGSWASPVAAALIADATIRLGQIRVQGDDIFWSEGRPKEQGRNVVVRRSADGAIHDLNPPPFDVRTTVHEYGGGAFALHGETLLFSHFADQKLYRIGPSGTATALTHAPQMRYADAVVDAARQRLIAVREDHARGDIEAVATLVAINLRSGDEQVLAGGHDFFSSPRLSPDGKQLAWLSWDHPNMPWDGTTLWLADIAVDGTLVAAQAVAGGPGESIFQPAWSPARELHFVSDRTGWWNLYRLRGGVVQPLCPMAAEFGEPQWAFGMSSYGFDGGGRIICTYAQLGRSQLALLDTETLRIEPISTPFCAIASLQVGAGFAVFIGGSETAPEAIVRIDLASRRVEVLRSASSASADAAYISRAQAISYPTEGGLQAHAFFYAPANRDFTGASGERPPLLVFDHGGPTSATGAAFKWSIQFWTSRGFAVVDVNYGGSSGYGRAYRERLNGQWGVVDVDDSVNAARFLVARGDVNPHCLAIRGASAGGYTTLSALTFRSFFHGGASHYGIGDLEALARDTHKFESRYLDRLIGPYPAAQALYVERSPINFTDRLSSPMILLQGTEDRAVPPAQAQAMFDAVRAKGLPVALLMFEGEQHGFRRAATIQRALEAELYFYGRIFGFTPADPIEPVAIENL